MLAQATHFADKASEMRRRMINMSLKLAAAHAKARVMSGKASDAESRLFAAEQAAQVAAVREGDAEARATLLQAHAVEKEQEASLAQQV